MVLRDRDMSNGWTGAADGTLEERLYTCQNWRADVVALVAYDGGTTLAEWAKYSAYGIPFGMPVGDTDSDGDQDATDVSQVQTWIGVPTYDVRGDTDLDGDLDEDDVEFLENIGGAALGRGALSTSALSGGVGSRKGYAGYEFDANVGTKYHVRHRVLGATLGRWLERDPLGYHDSLNLTEYAKSLPTTLLDPSGAGCDSAAPKEPNDEDCWNAYGRDTVFDECWTFPAFGGCVVTVCGQFIPACVCACTPDSPYSNDVRGCLQCEMKKDGYVDERDHAYCLGQLAGPDPGVGELAGIVGCIYGCRRGPLKATVDCWWGGPWEFEILEVFDWINEFSFRRRPLSPDPPIPF